MGILGENSMKSQRGFTWIQTLAALFVIGILVLAFGNTVYGWMNSRTVVGYVDKVSPLMEDGGMAVGDRAARLAKSSAVSIKLASGQYFTFSSEDRQWFTLKGDQQAKPKCVRAKAFPYAPWYFTKSGTYHDGRLLAMADTCEGLWSSPHKAPTLFPSRTGKGGAFFILYLMHWVALPDYPILPHPSPHHHRE